MRTSHNDSWSRRKFLGAGALIVGALMTPSIVVNASMTCDRIVRRRELWAMGGWNYLEVSATTEKLAAESLDCMVSAIREIDRLFSVFDARSPVSRFNSEQALSVAIDNPFVLDSVRESLEWAQRCHGVFDPTVEPIMERLGFRDARASEGKHTERDWGYSRVVCDLKNARIDRDSRSLQIDTGGWAKGLAAEHAARAATSAGATVAQVSCGGDIYRLDTADQSTWACAIRDPLRGRLDHAVRVTHRFPTVATSANYETYRLTETGQRIGHLLDPRTGAPAATDLLSVSLFGQSGLATDAASSALFVMGKSSAIEWLGANPSFGAVLVDCSWPTSGAGISVVGDLEIS